MKIIFYHTLTCPQCKMIERLLIQNNIQYISCVDTKEMLSRGITRPPILEVDGESLSGKAIIDWIKENKG